MKHEELLNLRECTDMDLLPVQRICVDEACSADMAEVSSVLNEIL